MSQTKVVDNIKTDFEFSNFLSRKSCRLWVNVGEYVARDRPQMRIWQISISCWVP